MANIIFIYFCHLGCQLGFSFICNFKLHLNFFALLKLKVFCTNLNHKDEYGPMLYDMNMVW